MKLTYLMWGYPYDDAICRAFSAAGILLEKVAVSGEFLKENGEEAYAFLKEKIRAGGGDIVFSVNFLAWVSDFCQREEVPYCCWILSLPNFDLYTSSVQNACNYLGVCDSYLTEKLWQIGVGKAFFLPDAVELDEPVKTVPVEREACFIARCPESVLYTEEMTAYGKGYLDAFIHAQRVLYGASILENGLLGRVRQEFCTCNPVPEKILPEMQKLYLADRYFAPACTRLQQNVFLQNFSSIMTIYSDGDFSGCDCEKKAFVEREVERRKIYAGKEFSLVLAPHILHNGIPRDTLEVIAAGGFPIAGFQRDYAFFFKKDINLAYFTNPKEFSQSVVRYGNSMEERERVKNAAFETLKEGHTYLKRIPLMMEMWEKL